MFGTRNRVRDGIKSALGRVFRRETELPAEPYPPLCRLVAAYDAESASPDILYLGDSVLERVAHQDRDRRLVHEILADRVAERHRVCGLSHAAFNPAVYLALVRCLTRLKQRPKTVIIPVNLRCFSPQWDLDPAYQFAAEIELLNAFAAGDSKSVPTFRPVETTRDLYERLDQTQVSIEGSPLTSVGQFRLVMDSTPSTTEQTRFREQQIFSFFYMHRLTREHRRVVALIELVALLRDFGMQELVYATPINVGAAQAALGVTFLNPVRGNAATLAESLGDSVRLLDWSEALQPEYFFHGKLHAEHLNERGRARLAELVAGALVTR